ncbi:MAG: hypothetical protein ACFFCI_20305 [Promethearchaeota archaeon]
MGWGNAKQLTFNEVNDGAVSISGDGTKIAFNSFGGGDSEICVINFDGTGLKQLTQNTAADYSPSISGDGTKIAFTSDVDGDFEIFIVNSDGTGLTQLTNNNVEDRHPSISRDGSKIVYTQDDGDYRYEIFVINSDGSGLTQLTDYEWAYNGIPSINGDGTKIAFSSHTGDDDFELFIMNSDGSGLTQLTNDTADDVNPRFSGDGSKIAFSQDGIGLPEIFIINSDGSGLTQLTDDLSSHDNPYISYDGSKIVFTTGYDVFIIDSDTSDVTRLTYDDVAVGSACISDDCTKIAFRSSIDGDNEVFVIQWETLSEFVLEISSVGSGSTTPAEGDYTYLADDVIDVTAIADFGYMLDHWLLDGVNVGNANPITVTMDPPHTLVAVFIEIPPTIHTLEISVTGFGSTSPSTGSELYEEETEVVVTASPDFNYNFSHWILDSVDAGSTNPIEITMDADHNLTAVFIYSGQLDEQLPTRELLPTEYTYNGHSSRTLDAEGFLEARSVSYERIIPSLDPSITWTKFTIYRFSNSEYANSYIDGGDDIGGYTEIEIPNGTGKLYYLADFKNTYSWVVLDDKILEVNVYSNNGVESVVNELKQLTLLWVNEIPEFPSITSLLIVTTLLTTFLVIVRLKYEKKNSAQIPKAYN